MLIWCRRLLSGLIVALAGLLVESQARATDRPHLQVAQLDIMLGPAKLGSKKCGSKKDPGCSKHRKNQELERKHKKKNSEKGAKRKPSGIGIGIVIEGPDNATKSKKKNSKKNPGTAVSTKKDKKKNDRDKNKDKGGNSTPAANGNDDPKDKPVFVPPEFPALAMRDCEDCYELWDSIQWYELIIDADARKLFDRRREIDERRREVEDLQKKLPDASSIDKAYFTQEIARHTKYISAIDKLNDELADLIEREWAILRERIDQYAECTERHCPIQVVTEQVVVTPETPATAAPEEPPSNPAPEETAPEYEGSATGKVSVGIDTGFGKYDVPMTPDYGPPLPRSRPPEDDRKICGPDITPAVIKTLKKIREDFNNNPDKQVAACRALIDPRTGGSAWDIDKLSPAGAVPKTYEGEPPFSYEKEFDAWVQRDANGGITSWKQPWFTSESPMCAIPRNDPVCAPTVEFFGICEHAQIVNYVQWRFMLGLCGGAYPYAGALLHKAWNTFQYGGNAPQQQQANMSEVAKKILDKLDSDEDAADFSDIAADLVALDAGVNKEIRQCELKCDITIDREFSYIWTGLTRDSPIPTGRLDRDLNDMANEGAEKMKSKAEAAGVTTDSLRPSPILSQILKALGLN